MTFTKPEFGLFLGVVFLFYWLVLNKDLKLQNTFLLIASYFFYGWWDWRFLVLIFISSSTDFFVGLLLDRTDDRLRRRIYLFCSIIVNLGILFFFKYFNFFLDTLRLTFGLEEEGFSTLNIILPVGISFYTLQTLSYTIDVYDRKIKATADFVSFFAYVSFFPQLVAGPIERASDLLPQFQKRRVFDYPGAVDGLRQILWGLFKKLVIADNCGLYVDLVFEEPGLFGGSTLFLALVLVAFQFYCDFSGYSDIAIGSARLLGFNLSKNFDFPFFARNVSEFWQKWHITLINWFRYYIINRLKGFSKPKITRNIFFVFFITGLWHGANYTYIFWGVLHAATFLPLIYGKRIKHRHLVANGRCLPNLREIRQMTGTFLIFISLGVFFRIDTIPNGIRYLTEIFSSSFFTRPLLPSRIALAGILILLVTEWLQRGRNHGLEIDGGIPAYLRWGIYYSVVLAILLLGARTTTFIYFQF